MSTTDKALSGAVIALNASALGLQLLGQTKAAEGVRVLAAALDAGVAIDAHMADVAAKLQAGSVTEADWDDVIARVHAASDELQAAKATG
jgi:hypothetical protein